MKLYLQMFSEEGEVTETAPEENTTDTDARFEELIKGEYSDAFSKRVQGIIHKRFSKMKAMEKSLEAYTPLKEHLGTLFPHISADDTEGLVEAFLKSTKENGTAKTEGKLSPDFLRSCEGLLKMKAAERIKDVLLRDSAELRRLYPSFDLKRELSSSPEMCRLITAGVPLRRAYEAVNMEKIMGSVLSEAVLRAKADAAESIRNSTRVQENSLADRASSVKHTDVNNLTESEIRKIIADVGNGARVTF